MACAIVFEKKAWVVMGKKFEIAEKKYRPLKRELKKIFKTISESAENGELPAAGVMDSFMAYTEMMVSYPGFGDENYQLFTSGCREMFMAFKKADLAGFGDALEAVKEIKRECHFKK